MFGRLLEGPRLLVPLGAVGPQALQNLLVRSLSKRANGIVLRPALMPSISACSGASSGLQPSVKSVSIRVRAPGAPTSRTFASWGIQSVP